MKESSYQRQLQKRLNSLENHWNFTHEAGSKRSLPDVIGTLNSHFYCLEVKKDLASMNERTGRIVLQKYTLNKIRETGGFAEFICPENEEEVLKNLNDHCKGQSLL